MKLLLICGQVWPQKNNNANLVWNLIPYLRQMHEIQVLSICSGTQSVEKACSEIDGIRVWFSAAFSISKVKRLQHRITSAFQDRGDLGDAFKAKAIADCMRQIFKVFSYEAVLATIEPYASAVALLQFTMQTRSIIYLMDPTIYKSPASRRVRYRVYTLSAILSSVHAVITTPFIQNALRKHGYDRQCKRLYPVGFPLIERHESQKSSFDNGRIHLLFCGWLYSDIRSPKYFLDILSRLDERFVVTFMGRECENLTERFDVQTKAKLITLPQQPYETALQAMADADIMINIGNSVPVHMPSKTLEYINTGKPFVNFYKMDDCPTLYYSKRYPLCLNLSEQDPDIDAAARRFIEFCTKNKGKSVDRAFIESEYADCTPEYIAQKILDALGE